MLRHTMKRILWLIGILALGTQPAAVADAPVPSGQARTTAAGTARPRSSVWIDGIGSGFRTGTTQTGFSLGPGWGSHAFGSKNRHDLALATTRFGRVFTGIVGEKEWYRGSPELLGELWGGTQSYPTDRSLFGFTPIIRYNFATGSRWMPFVDGGVGLAYTNILGRDLSTRFEFNVQVGAGAHYFLGRRTALTVQYRWFHLSNAGIKEPNNGTNTQILLAGLSQFF
jgi:lipid A 3-O-deacylase